MTEPTTTTEVVAPAQAGAQSPPGDALTRALLASVFVIAACGLVYELIAAAMMMATPMKMAAASVAIGWLRFSHSSFHRS